MTSLKGWKNKTKANWRNDPITKKQEEMILSMQETTGMNGGYIPPFMGTTKGEASDYISENIGKQYISLYNPHEDGGDRI